LLTTEHFWDMQMKLTFNITPLSLSLTVEKVGIFHSRMKKLFVLILVMLTSCIACKINHDSQYWAKTFGGDEKDYAEFTKQTSDGGYIVTGYTESFGAGDPDFWILKLQSNGDVTWQKTYGDSDWDISNAIIETSDISYIVVGMTQSFGAGGFDVWILNLDQNGNILWQRTYGGSSSDWAYSVQQTSDGEYIIGGYTSSFGIGKIDLWILKITDTGNISWQKTYGGSEDDFISSVQQSSDEGYIVTGYTKSFGAEASDIWVLKLESNGDVSWQKTYGRRDYEDFNSSIQETSDGGYILTGYTYLNSLGEGHIWVSKFNSNGAVMWEKTYEGNDKDYPYSIQQTFDATGNDTGYIIASHTTANDTRATTPCDISLLKLGTTGNISWQKTYRLGIWSNPSYVQQSTDGGYIITGYTQSFSGEALILKVDNNGDIPNCEIINESNFLAFDTSFIVKDSNCTIQSTDAIINETNVLPRDSSAEITTICEGDN